MLTCDSVPRLRKAIVRNARVTGISISPIVKQFEVHFAFRGAGKDDVPLAPADVHSWSPGASVISS